eukprot:GSMAST32.ASY1.ANO1.312.1 assembled CDS
MSSTRKIQPKKSAYNYFRKEMGDINKTSGDTFDFAQLNRDISEKWRCLSDSKKSKYLKLAEVDAIRYEAEMTEADEIKLKELQDRREKELIIDPVRVRLKALACQSVDNTSSTKSATSDSEYVREIDRSAIRNIRDAKAKERDRLHTVLEKKRKIASEKRMKYLMGQSTLFSHFISPRHFGKTTSPRSPRSPRRSPRSPRNLQATPSRHERMQEAAEDKQLLAETLGTTNSGPSTRLEVQPSLIKFGTLRPYQMEGLNWLIQLHESGVNGILADEMAFLAQFKNVKGPHLIVVPKSTLGNWMNEFKRWCPSFRTVMFHGDKSNRFDVCITSYEIAIIAKTALKRHAWEYIAVDEAHRLKNEKSKLATALRSFHCFQKLLITGTPLQNNLHELWALLNFLLPEVFSSSEDFDSWFDLDTQDDKAKEKMIHQLHKIMRPFMLRLQLYKKILLREMDTGGNRVKLSNILMQLRKVCNHPYLFDDPNGEHLVQNCGKMVLLDKLLCKLKARGNRVLIFSQMTRLLDILEDYCSIRDYSYCRIDGNTTGDDRQEQIDEFNAPNSELFLFLLSTRAGGLGINLQTADTVILFDSDWNPQVDLQAQDRAHRIGQKKQVRVYRLLTEKSVEEKIIERAEMKLRLDAVVVQNGRLPASSKQLTKAEMQSMVKYGANEVFRAKGSMLTDQDIDQILAKGEERTKAMQKRMNKTLGDSNGDLLNFSISSSSMQEFDGEDYSLAARKKKEQEELEKMMALEDRKKVAYNTDAAFRDILGENSEPRVRKVKLPKVMQNPPVVVLLSPELQSEKNTLLAAGFEGWKRRDLMEFVSACERFGRDSVVRIYKEMIRRNCDKKQEEVEAYSKRFWEVGEKCLPDFSKFLNRIERGEAKLTEQDKLKDWTSAQDRYIVCWVAQHGINRWDDLQRSIRTAQVFNFDYLFHTRNPDELARRCFMLLKICMKEYTESERRQKALTTKQMNGVETDSNMTTTGKLQSNVLSEISNDKDQRRGSTKLFRPVPEKVLPILARLLIDSGSNGVSTVVNEFVEMYPSISKRQVAMKIAEIAEKAKRKGDSRLVWYIRESYQHLLDDSKTSKRKADTIADGLSKKMKCA